LLYSPARLSTFFWCHFIFSPQLPFFLFMLCSLDRLRFYSLVSYLHTSYHRTDFVRSSTIIPLCVKKTIIPLVAKHNLKADPHRTSRREPICQGQGGTKVWRQSSLRKFYNLWIVVSGHVKAFVTELCIRLHGYMNSCTILTSMLHVSI